MREKTLKMHGAMFRAYKRAMRRLVLKNTMMEKEPVGLVRDPHNPKLGAQVFVVVYKYNEDLRREAPETDGLVINDEH